MEFLRSAPRTDLHVSVSQIKCFQMCPKNCAQSALMRTNPRKLLIQRESPWRSCA